MGKASDPRAEYVAIATSKFAADGYHGTSLAALANEAGVTKQALLHFFGTKERLYAEVLASLANRLHAAIDAAHSPDPVTHLRNYFLGLRASVIGNRDDAQLVMRALLDSNEAARNWPLKAYLDRLVELTQQTPRGRSMSKVEALGWAGQIIGATQYLAISQPAVSGMYGKEAASQVASHFDRFVEKSVDSLNADSRPPTA